VYFFPLLGGYYIPATWALSRFSMRRVRLYKYLFLDNAMTYQKDVIPLGSHDIEMSLVPDIERPAYLAFHALQAYDLTPRLSEIRAPVLIVHGEQDNTVPVASARLAHQHIPHSQLVIYDPCGHTPYLETPQQLHETLKRFLAQDVPQRTR
jgi:pimeloyl-ACP methyl ester carboxylesterase